MVQAIIKIGDHEDRVLTIIKGKYGLKNKSEAINFVIDKFEKEILEPELRPVYIGKIKSLEKTSTFSEFNSIEDLKRDIENA